DRKTVAQSVLHSLLDLYCGALEHVLNFELLFFFQNDRLSRFDPGLSNTAHNEGPEQFTNRTGFSTYRGSKQGSLRAEKEDTLDYKKLYEQFLAENEKLKASLHDTNLELNELKVQLEKTTQRQERIADRSLLEMEKRERRALERKIAEMEEELKVNV
ncbi:protein phosphatase 1 regulatory subunit 12A-like, partial [Rhincodon typus]|uniref:protein phosphatase 1 regulatory subunit 12A-like n=1 Tax=Rhincodon typus TaxID=259920 RepID=UPI0020309BB4